MAWYRCRHTGSGGGVTPIGDATDGDVLSGKTYMNANGASTGTMTDNGAVSKTLNTTTTSYTVPEGYHNGSGTVSITTQTKSCTPTTSSQTITPDSGKVLSSVSVGTQVHTETKSIAAGTSTASTDLTATHNYRYISVAPTPSQEKTVTSSRSNQTVTPDSGKLLSKVTVSGLAPTGTYTASSRGASLDMGTTSNYRYVNTNSVPNSNSGTKTISSSDTNWYTGNVDMGATNTYRYVNAVAVYNKGVSDGGSVFVLYFSIYSAHFRIGYLNTNTKTMTLSAITSYNSSVTLSGLTVTMDAYGSGDNISRLQTNKACSFQTIANGGSEIKISIPANTKTSLTGVAGGWFGVLTM